MKRRGRWGALVTLAGGLVVSAAVLGWARGAQAQTEQPAQAQRSGEVVEGDQESRGEMVRPLEELALEVNQDRRLRTSRAMGVLLGWSALNLGVGAVGYARTDGSERYFYEMTMAWNAVNAAIAGVGLVGARREDPAEFDALQTLEEGRSLEKILLINMGLNVGYMAAGMFLRERGMRTDDDRLRGYGPAVVGQGAFLLIFDTTLFSLQRRASNRYRDELRWRLF